MLYLGLKQWERALLFLEIVIVSPANNTASMIQVEAYKKWVLVGLLLEGRVRLATGLRLYSEVYTNRLIANGHAKDHEPASSKIHKGHCKTVRRSGEYIQGRK